MMVIRSLLRPQLLFCSAANAAAINPPANTEEVNTAALGDRDNLGIIYNCKAMLRVGETCGSRFAFCFRGTAD